MLRRFIFNGFNNKQLGVTSNKIYKGKMVNNKLVIWNDFNEECNGNIEDFDDITESLRFMPYFECVETYKTLEKGELYQAFQYNNNLFAIDACNKIIPISNKILKEFNSINISLFSGN